MPTDNSIDKAKSYQCEEDCNVCNDRLLNQEFYINDIGFKLADIPL